jgi:eukaryotic-like serine/threonine-protein kinase
MTDTPFQLKLESFSFEVVTLNAVGFIKQHNRSTAQRFLEDLGNGLKLEMVAIPAGEFLMGAPTTEIGSEDDERPQHLVKIPSFYIGRYPITQKQYEKIMGHNPSRFKGANFPVENLSWYDAQVFCQNLMEHTKKNYRLPGEAEWEYACRAKTTTPFNFGETISTEVANYDGRDYPYGLVPKSGSRVSLTAVGSFPPNNFGLHDMHGNIWEWCADAWHDDYIAAPIDGSVWQKAVEDYARILRGGSWCDFPAFMRSSSRRVCDSKDQENSNGLRVVLSNEIMPRQ